MVVLHCAQICTRLLWCNILESKTWEILSEGASLNLNIEYLNFKASLYMQKILLLCECSKFGWNVHISQKRVGMSSQFHVPKSFDNKMTQLNLKDDNSDNLTVDSESATVSSDEDMLNDFLTLKAKMLISSLQNKKQTLEDDLKIYKCDIGNMREKLNNAEKFEKKINKELDASKRDVNKKEQLLKEEII
ncbi:hypothetical protein Avbf_09511 [Armadillidium vulgare]|nr:hypothetical protein Avbf_09511 [Armadillidium vulgare]